MTLPKALRGFLIVNSIVLGFMLLYVVIFSTIINFPETPNEIVLVSVVIIDVAVLLYKSGSSLNEYEKYFNGLTVGIAGCVLSALAMGILPLIPWIVMDFYIYGITIVYALLISIFYIFFNEMFGKKE